MNIKPLHDRVLVRRNEEETVTTGGIVLAPSSQEKQLTGVVLAIGNGKHSADGTHIKLCVKVGDEIMFSKFSGTEVKNDGEDLLIMKEDDIFAIIG